MFRRVRLCKKASQENLGRPRLLTLCPGENSPSFPLEYILSGIFYAIHDQMAGTGSQDWFRIKISSETQSTSEKGRLRFSLTQPGTSLGAPSPYFLAVF